MSQTFAREDKSNDLKMDQSNYGPYSIIFFTRVKIQITRAYEKCPQCTAKVNVALSARTRNLYYSTINDEPTFFIRLQP